MLDSLNHISGLCINIYRNFICVPGIWHAAAMLALRTRPSVVVISQLCYNLVFFFFGKNETMYFFYIAISVTTAKMQNCWRRPQSALPSWAGNDKYADLSAKNIV